MGSSVRQVVIVGSGHAGVAAAASLREEGFDGVVTIVGEEADLPYHKPPLSKAFLKDPAAEPQILRAQAYYTAERIDLRLAPASRSSTRGAGGSTSPAADPSVSTRSFWRPARAPALPPCPARASTACSRCARWPMRARSGSCRSRWRTWSSSAAASSGSKWRRRWLPPAPRHRAGGAGPPARPRLCAGGLRPRRAPAHHFRRARRHRRGRREIRGNGGQGLGRRDGDGMRIPAGMVLVGIGAMPNAEIAADAGIVSANGVPVDATMRSAFRKSSPSATSRSIATGRRDGVAAGIRAERPRPGADRCAHRARP